MEDFIRRRLLDLAAQADRTGSYTFSPFLNEAELSDFYTLIPQLPPCGYTVFGGHEDAERAMVRFGSSEQLGYEEPFPIVCIEIAPLQQKFAEALTHRDLLGAVMHLGIERTETGDILIRDSTGYLFCTPKIGEYICRELSRVRHTSVRCTEVTEIPSGITGKTEAVQLQVSSLRIDGIIAKLWRISRSDCLTLFRSDRVFLNGRCTEHSSVLLREGDRVSVRGYGKFRFAGVEGQTRKGNLIVTAERFAG